MCPVSETHQSPMTLIGIKYNMIGYIYNPNIIIKCDLGGYTTPTSMGAQQVHPRITRITLGWVLIHPRIIIVTAYHPRMTKYHPRNIKWSNTRNKSGHMSRLFTLAHQISP